MYVWYVNVLLTGVLHQQYAGLQQRLDQFFAFNVEDGTSS